jgi:hypothetical protein
MTWLPENYKEPEKPSNYLKIKENSEIKIRILSRPIIGWEEWKDGKPIRYKDGHQPEKSLDPQKQMDYFWSCIVYDIAENKIKILQIKKISIRNQIVSFMNDKDYGPVHNYDLKIKREGSGMKTKYIVMPLNICPVSENVIDLFNSTPCNLDALFISEDPFSPEQLKKGITPLCFDDNKSVISIKEENKPTLMYINKQQLGQFLDVRNRLSDNDQMEIEMKLKKLGVENYSEIPLATFELFIPSMIARLPASA